MFEFPRSQLGQMIMVCHEPLGNGNPRRTRPIPHGHQSLMHHFHIGRLSLFLDRRHRQNRLFLRRIHGHLLLLGRSDWNRYFIHHFRSRPLLRITTILFSIIIVVIVFFFVIVTITKLILIIILCLVLVIFSIRIVGVIGQVSESGVNDFGQMWFDFFGATKDKGFKTGKATLPQFIGECNGSFILVLICIFHVLVFRIFLVVSRRRIIWVAKTEKNGDNAINLFLAETVTDGPRYGAHGANQCARV
mmetsp:Transcript_27892/g.50732  ORF Transcript_27892/g.50732 Transcript_27892/m.50732 type:complete len:247 (+) Transcript_27892:3957-4697(+)